MNTQSAIVTHGSCDRCEGVGDILEIVAGWVNRRTYLCVPCWRLLVNIAEKAIDDFVSVGGVWPVVKGGR